MSEQGADGGSRQAPERAATLPPTAADADAFVAALRPDARASFQDTRWVFLRALGFVYVVAFAILVNQGQALIGSQGLLPAAGYLARVQRSVSFAEHPTLFWFGASDRALAGAAWLGLVQRVRALRRGQCCSAQRRAPL